MTVGSSPQQRATGAEGGLPVPCDGSVVVGLFLIALAMRIPFRSQYAYHWDSAQFALAIREFDIRLSQPHAPGYFLYVMLGRLVNDFVGDPHASLVWISVVFGSALPSLLYVLATRMFGRWAGGVAAGMALTSPQLWFHSCVALTYIVDSFLVCAVVLVLWRAMKRGGEWRDAVIVGVLLAIAGGVREQTVAALAPLIAYVFWRFKNARVGKLAVATAVTVGLSTLWFVPMIRTSGGLKTYIEISRRHAISNASATFLGGGLDALLKNVANVAGFCWNGLVLGAVALFVAHLYRMFRMTPEQKTAWNHQHSNELVFLSIWIVPMMMLGTLVGFTKQPGYVLSYLPGWFVLVGIVVASLRRRRQRVTLISVICATNVLAFVNWPPWWGVVFFKMARSAHEIAEHDRQMARMVATIRREYSPEDVVICHADEFYLYGLRHFQLYLPEYEQYQLAIDETALHPLGKPIWRVQDGRLGFVDSLDRRGNKKLVLLVPPGEDVTIFAPYFSPDALRDLSQRVVR